MKRMRMFGLSVVAVATLAAVTADGAAAARVELRTEGRAASPGEPTEISSTLALSVGEAGCRGDDEGGTVGRNPATAAKITGTGRDEPAKECVAEHKEFVNGGLEIKSLSIAASGKVVVKLRMAVEIPGIHCTYEVVELQGVQTFGEATTFFVSGKARLQKGVAQAKGCVKKPAAEGFVSARSQLFPESAYVAELRG